MQLKELKKNIMDKNVIEDMIIFKYEDTDFVPNQYVKEIASILGKEISYVDTIQEARSNGGFFGEEPIFVVRIDNLKTLIEYNRSVVVMTKAVSEEVMKELGQYVVEVPKLEQWMVEDYVASYCDGLDEDTIKWFASRYNDIYHITEELDKLTVFPIGNRQLMFKKLHDENGFSPSDDDTVIAMLNAVQSRNHEEVERVLCKLQENGTDYIGMIGLIQNSIKRLIKVWLNKNPTPDNTGMKSNQIYAISKLRKVYSREKLIQIFEDLSLLDSKIMNSEFPSEIAMDWAIIKILE